MPQISPINWIGLSITILIIINLSSLSIFNNSNPLIAIKSSMIKSNNWPW